MSRRGFKIQTLSVYVSTTLVLVLLGTMGLLLVAARTLSNQVKEDLSVSVVLGNDVNEKQILDYHKRLSKRSYVKKAVYISKEQVLDEQRKELGTDPVEFLGYNPYEASIELSMKPEFANNESLATIEKELRSDKGVKDVIYHKELIGAINSNIHKIGGALLVLLALLGIISWSLIANMVRLTIYSKRFLLHTMKLVGATWGFIRRPFLVHNMWIGFFSGIMANILLAAALYFLSQREPAIMTVLPFEWLGIIAGGIVLFGIVITVMCAFFSVNRFLRMRGNDLYFI
ncbi:MAG: permease-like cell division protein FtsX [Bacteroidaceae bacterium]|nr:permease-like cell division protein FtsX [Bacteroidaceae bacterium]